MACCSLFVLAAPSESEVLGVLASQGVDAHMSQLVDSATNLDESVTTLCKSANEENLNAARKSWHKAFIAWRESLPFLIEPANKLEASLGKPINDIVLNAVVSSAEFSSMRKESDVRGYTGVEFLLFSPKNAEQVVADLRCIHLNDLIKEIREKTTAARDSWIANFRDGFVLAGNGEPYLIPGDALSLIVAKWLNTTETILRDGLRVPSNNFDGKAKPKMLNAPYSRSSRAGFEAALTGLESMLVGDGKSGLLHLVATKDGLAHKKDPQLAEDIVEQFSELKETLAEFEQDNLDLYSALEQDEDSLQDFYQQLNELQQLVVKAVQVLELDIRAGLEAKLMRQ